MSKLTFSITSPSGTATVVIYGADSIQSGSILLNNSFKEALPVSTGAERTIVGSAVIKGLKTEKQLIWSKVQCLLTATDYLTLKAVAMKSDKKRRSGTDLSIVMKDEFYPYVEDGPSATRSIATGTATAIGATGSIWYYASYNVAIVNFETNDTNLHLNGVQGFDVTFDIVELDKKTP